MKLYAVILCGGRGERFWPRSRRGMPKQFIKLFGDESLTRRTSERIDSLCPAKRKVFVAPAEFANVIRDRSGKVGKFLFEPQGRNTGPAIGYAAAYLAAIDPDATMVVLPADHLIERRREFLSSVRLAARLAQKGLLVTFGIPPSRPDTGYGYIQTGEKIAGRGRLTAHQVLGFHEKPNLAKARRYLKAGNYLWNSGMFVWRVDTILEGFGKFMPGFHRMLLRFKKAVGTRHEDSVLKAMYEHAPVISIDYAVMEKAENIAAVRATFDWDDVGSWLALARHSRHDKNSNVLKGLCLTKDAKNCIVDSDEGIIAVLGVKDLVIVRSGDAVLVAHQDKVAEIKELLKQARRVPAAKRFL